ncbi:MAG: hypothetical protein NE330_18440 [Lentisphaeraceae bacterium]|nr:hypothetical protein [Lentisphaeraceae bacterium]
MKNCKSCQKEIDEKATKCPYCQGYQKWGKSPQILGLIFPLIFIPIIFTSTGLWNQKDYIDYKDSFQVETVSSSIDNNYKIHTYKISNSTAHKWKNITYQFIGTDKSGKVVIVKSDAAYSWAVMPNSSSMISIKVEKNPLVAQWKLKVLDMKSGRF